MSLATRTASSSSSKAMTARTGPKISSRATRMSMVTPAYTVGWTKKPPLSSGPSSSRKSAGPPATSRAPSRAATSKYPLTFWYCACVMSGPR